MKTSGLALILVGLCLIALPAMAQTPATSYTLKTAENKYWQVDGFSGNNPDLPVPANTQITVTAVNADAGVHNLKVGDGETQDLNSPDAEVTTTFTSGADGTRTQYICTIHPSTMKGNFVVGTASSNNGGDGGNDSPGFGLVAGVLVLAGVAMFVARRNK